MEVPLIFKLAAAGMRSLFKSIASATRRSNVPVILVSYWGLALYGGLQASVYATVGWALIVIVQAVAMDWKVLLSLPCGPVVHLIWNQGRPILLGIAFAAFGVPPPGLGGSGHGSGSGDGADRRLWWKRWTLPSFLALAAASTIVLHEWAVEHFYLFAASVLTLFPAGVVLTYAALVFSPVWARVRKPGRALSERSADFLGRALIAIPISLVVAAVIAGVAALISELIDPSNALRERYISFLWWWTPAVFGFIAVRKAVWAVLVSFLLVIFAGVADTWAIHYFRQHPKPGTVLEVQEKNRTPNERHRDDPNSFVPPREGRITRSIEAVLNAFDPRHFLRTVADPNVPTSFWLNAEEEALHGERRQKEAEREPQNEMNGRAWANIFGCPGALTSAEIREGHEALYWLSPTEARLIEYQARHGVFCREVLRPKSNMFRTWIVLALFALGVVGAIRLRPKGQLAEYTRFGPIARKALGITVLSMAAVLVLAKWTRHMGERPSIKRFSVSQVATNYADLIQLKLTWIVDKGEDFEVTADPSMNVGGLPISKTATEAYVTIPANHSDKPVDYKFTLRVTSPVSGRSAEQFRYWSLAPGRVLSGQITRFGARKEQVVASAMDPTGECYIASTTAGESFITRYSPDGRRVWRNDLGSAVTLKGLAVGNNGVSCLVGLFESPPEDDDIHLPSFESNPGSGVIGAFDRDGRPLWRQDFGFDQRTEPNSVAVDRQGNCYIGGTTGPTTGLTSFSHSDSDAFVVKYDPNGNQCWHKEIGTDFDEGATGVAADSAGHVYLTGYTEAVALHYGNLRSWRQAFLAKFDDGGCEGKVKWAWVHQFGAAETEHEPRIAVDPDWPDDVFVSGEAVGEPFLGLFGAAGEEKWFGGTNVSGSTIAAGGQVYLVLGEFLADCSAKPLRTGNALDQSWPNCVFGRLDGLKGATAIGIRLGDLYVTGTQPGVENTLALGRYALQPRAQVEPATSKE